VTKPFLSKVIKTKRNLKKKTPVFPDQDVLKPETSEKKFPAAGCLKAGNYTNKIFPSRKLKKTNFFQAGIPA
jgi:hypothetical protein